MSSKNLKALVGALIVLLVGGIISYFDCYYIHSESGFFTGIGCSLIASGLVSILHSLYIENRAKKSIDEWNMDKIYDTRAEKNSDSDPKLAHATDRVDGIAFGLGSFRRNHTSQVEDCLRRGVCFRFITMDPNSKFAEQRDIEEKVSISSTAHSINQLIDWANELNSKGYPGKISIKGYSCMTLDFYWRIDDEIYMGPYWYGYLSQQTVTYKFCKGGKGFDLYKDYFSRLWDDDVLMKKLA